MITGGKVFMCIVLLFWGAVLAFLTGFVLALKLFMEVG